MILFRRMRAATLFLMIRIASIAAASGKRMLFMAFAEYIRGKSARRASSALAGRLLIFACVANS